MKPAQNCKYPGHGPMKLCEVEAPKYTGTAPHKVRQMRKVFRCKVKGCFFMALLENHPEAPSYSDRKSHGRYMEAF